VGGGRGAAGAEVERRRREDRGAEGGEVWGGGVPRKIFDFGSQYGEFWCILDGIFHSPATCFTRKTGVQPLYAYKSRDGE